MSNISKLETLGSLKKGKHTHPAAGACVMEAVAYVAGEPWSDHPECVGPVIGAFLRNWNDNLPTDDDRDRLLRPLVPKILNTRADAATEERRFYFALDWLIRTNLPTWLRLAKLDEYADAIATLEPLVDETAVAAAEPVLDVARAAAENAARDAAEDAGRATRAWDAVRATAGPSVKAAAWHAVKATAWDTSAWAAVWAAAKIAAKADNVDLSATVADLQRSAVDLVKRMAALQDKRSVSDAAIGELRG